MNAIPHDREDEREEADETLLRAYTNQLYLEYRWIVRAYKLPLRPPLLRVTAHRSTWGAWDPETRTISISRKLIQEHPWDAVLEVLKHEMAHQMVTERRSNHEAPHGDAFQEACRQLHVASWAVSATGAVPDSIEPGQIRTMSREQERLLNKAEKLLSLARSTNEHEALLAMKRVRELYARHNLEQWRHESEDSFIRRVIYFKKHRVEKQIKAILALLVEHFFVRVIFLRAFDAKRLESYRAAEIVGTRENVEMADYVYHFLMERLDHLWREFKKAQRTGRTSRRDYQLGVVNGFQRKLRADKKEVLEKTGHALGLSSTSSTMALVARGEERLDEHLRALHPDLVTHKSRTTYRDVHAFQAGIEDGKEIVIHRGLQASTVHRDRRLPSGQKE